MVGTQTKSSSGQTAQEICTETQEPYDINIEKNILCETVPILRSFSLTQESKGED